jgi:hypothetical protein
VGGWEIGAAARIAPEAGGADGGRDSGMLCDDDGCVAGSEDALGGFAGPAIPSSVLFRSVGFWPTAPATCALDPGGGGGTAALPPAVFFPRPSKMSRSDPPPMPPLLSSDIRVS